MNFSASPSRFSTRARLLLGFAIAGAEASAVPSLDGKRGAMLEEQKRATKHAVEVAHGIVAGYQARGRANAVRESRGLIGDSVAKVEAGARLLGDTGTSIDQVVNSVKRVTDIMADITAASVEQSCGIQPLNQAVWQIDPIIRQQAALAEPAAAEPMEEQARALSRTVCVVLTATAS